MMNNLKVFDFEGSSVRTVLKEGNPWWVAKDVCEVLGISKHRDAVEKLDADEREPIKVDTLGGPQNMVCINESGLYTLIIRDRKSTRLNSSHVAISYAVFCLKKKRL